MKKKKANQGASAALLLAIMAAVIGGGLVAYISFSHFNVSASSSERTEYYSEPIELTSNLQTESYQRIRYIHSTITISSYNENHIDYVNENLPKIKDILVRSFLTVDPYDFIGKTQKEIKGPVMEQLREETSRDFKTLYFKDLIIQ